MGTLIREACVAAYVEAFAWYGRMWNMGTPARRRSIFARDPSRCSWWRRWTTGRAAGKEKGPGVEASADRGSCGRSERVAEWLRDALQRADSKAMNNLLTSAEDEDLLPSTLSMMGFSQSKQVTVTGERAAVLLQRAQQRHPADFWINHDLAILLHVHLQPPQLEEAIRYFMIAVALRPHSPGVHLNLGGSERQGPAGRGHCRVPRGHPTQQGLRRGPQQPRQRPEDKGQLDEAIADTARPSDSRRISPRPTTTSATPWRQGPAGRGHRRVPRGHPTQEGLRRCPRQPRHRPA